MVGRLVGVGFPGPKGCFLSRTKLTSSCPSGRPPACGPRSMSATSLVESGKLAQLGPSLQERHPSHTPLLDVADRDGPRRRASSGKPGSVRPTRVVRMVRGKPAASLCGPNRTGFVVQELRNIVTENIFQLVLPTETAEPRTQDRSQPNRESRAADLGSDRSRKRNRQTSFVANACRRAASCDAHLR